MERLIEIVANILEADKNLINSETSRDMVAKWDSFSHLLLVAEIEEEYRIKIPFEKIIEIKKVGDFLQYIQE